MAGKQRKPIRFVQVDAQQSAWEAELVKMVSEEGPKQRMSAVGFLVRLARSAPEFVQWKARQLTEAAKLK